MMNRTIFVLSVSLIMLDLAQSQVEKRIRRDNLMIQVKVTVMALPGNLHRFQYLFANDAASQQSMHRAIVELNDEWLEHGGTIRNVVAPVEKDWGEFPSVGEKMRWITQYDTTGLDILEKAPRSAILPGESLSFSFEAGGLPGIGTFWAAGWAPWFFSEEEYDSLLREGYPESELHATDDKFHKGLTIVRRSLPDPFIPLAFLDSLISYKHQAFSLGWIKNQGIVISLDAKLDNAKAQLQHNNNSSARNILQSFLNEVEALNKKGDQITSEAYALLKFNTEYLVSKL